MLIDILPLYGGHKAFLPRSYKPPGTHHATRKPAWEWGAQYKTFWRGFGMDQSIDNLTKWKKEQKPMMRIVTV